MINREVYEKDPTLNKLLNICGEVPHPMCACPVVQAIVNAVCSAVARERKGVAATPPQGPTGRPRTKVATQAARKNNPWAQQRADGCTPRHLWVKHPLSPSDRKRLWRLTRGLPQRRTWREMMEQVSALCDRCGRTQTARDKLPTLRWRRHRCTPLGERLTTLFAPTLEKALVFLDDQWWPSTSNKVDKEMGLLDGRRVDTIMMETGR
jgi:hypothetical protein